MFGSLTRKLRNFQTFNNPERRIAREGNESEEHLQDFIDEVREFDNSKIDLDPRRDQVLLLKEARWWQSDSETELLEYAINKTSYGHGSVTELIRKDPFNPESETKITHGDLIKYDYKNSHGLETNELVLRDNKVERHSREFGDPKAPKREAEELLSDVSSGSIAMQSLKEGGASALEVKVEELQAAPDPTEPPSRFHHGGRLSQQDLENHAMADAALAENARFGRPSVEEEFTGNGTREKVVKRGLEEDDRAVYKQVGRYWRSVGSNHDGMDKDKDWSDAFLTYVHQKAGSDSPLSRGESSASVIGAAFEDYNRDSYYQGVEFKRGEEARLTKGDLLVRNTDDGQKLDIVAEINHSTITVVSGDYNDSVVTRELDTGWSRDNSKPDDLSRYSGYLKAK